MIVGIVIWIKNLLYHLRLHARSVLHSIFQTTLYKKKELLRAAKSASLFLTVLFKCTTLCCKVLLQNCYTMESRRLRVCWSDAQSDTKRYPKRCPNMSYVTTGPRATQTNAGPQDRSKNSNDMWQQVLEDAKVSTYCRRSQSATTCDSSYAPNSTQYYSVLQSTTPVLVCTTRYHSSTTKYHSATWKRLRVLMYTTQFNDTPKSLQRRQLKKRWEISNVGWH